MKTNPLGSIWHRWDLHFHTPASFDYANNSVTTPQLIEGLIAAKIEVVAVTDHHVIDVIRIRQMQELGKDRITVLPGIELRSQLGGSESVHFIGVFSEDCDLDDVWTKLQSLGISYADVKQKGDDKVFVKFEEGCARIRELGGIVTVHAGRKTNSIETLTNADLVKRAVKTDYVHRYLHAYEIGKLTDIQGYKDKVFPEIGKSLPLLLCSDNHNIHQYAPKSPMWIKADPSFLGLLQLINEPTSRVHLGDMPPSKLRTSQNAPRYINSIRFERTAVAHEGEKWFSGELPINHGLVAIIGNKGSGKSALSDILALLGDTRTSQHFSFLNRERFLSPKHKLGTMFKATIVWKSGREVTKNLDKAVDTTSPELVKYIPQNYLDTICSELKQSTDTAFDRELMEVIYSHVGEADRLGKATLQDLIDYLTSETKDQIQQLASEIGDVNRQLAWLEEQNKPEYRKTLVGQLDERKADLVAHDAAKPAEVLEPRQNPSAQAQAVSITQQLHKINKEIADLEAQKDEAQIEDRQGAIVIAAAEKLLGRISNLERQYQAFLVDSASDASSLHLNLGDVLTLTINHDAVISVRSQADKQRESAREKLTPGLEDSLPTQITKFQKEAEFLRLQLDEPNRQYQSYLEELKVWSEKRAQIEGAPDIQNSVIEIELRISLLGQIPDKIVKLEERRKKLTREVFTSKEKLLSRYQNLYAPVQKFIDEHPISRDHKALQFRASVTIERFAEEFLKMIHQGRRGSFSGEQEGKGKLQSIIAATSFSSGDDTLAFIEQIVDHLKFDRRETSAKSVHIGDQLCQPYKPEHIYDFLFQLEYLQPRFELRWQDKSLDQLSPGERGNLLLLFYLLIDSRDIPLIIDQPEENLDNQTITKMLVPAIKEAKDRRQIIIVTHNPNLAVVCDADQVIYAHIDKANGNKVIYQSGAIENPAINRLIVDVLEGTKTAFDLRDAKYEVMERS